MASGTNYSFFQNAPLYAQNSGIVNQFGVSNWFWGSTVSKEPVLPLNASVDQSFRLWRKATAITSVAQLSSGTTFVDGTDYSLSADGWNLLIPIGSAIPSAPANFLSTVDPTSPYLSQSKKKDGSPLYLGNNYPQYQLAITYSTGSITSPESNPLQRLSGCLQNKTPTAITFFGDSITLGGVTSYSLSEAPNAPNFVQQVGAYLSTIAPGMVYWRNVSVSGMSSGGAVAAISTITDTPSDVVVVAFGMNDSSGGITKAAYKANIKSIIDSVLSHNAQTEFLLISGITSNPDWVNNFPKMHGYRDALHELVGQYINVTNITVVDVTAIWESMLINKSYYDLTANGVNHPGDFGHTLYAQTIIQALVGSEPA